MDGWVISIRGLIRLGIQLIRSCPSDLSDLIMFLRFQSTTASWPATRAITVSSHKSKVLNSLSKFQPRLVRIRSWPSPVPGPSSPLLPLRSLSQPIASPPPQPLLPPPPDPRRPLLLPRPCPICRPNNGADRSRRTRPTRRKCCCARTWCSPPKVMANSPKRDELIGAKTTLTGWIA